VLDADHASVERLVAGASRPAISSPLGVPSAWLEEMALETRDLDALVDGLFNRTLADPNPKSLAEAEAILNELGRDSKAAAFITAKLKAVSIVDINRSSQPREQSVQEVLAWETFGILYSGPNETGRLTLVALGKNARYAFCTSANLRTSGFYNQIQSGIIFASSSVDVSLVLFFQDDFLGRFVQLTVPRASAPMYFWSRGVKSLMLVATPSDRLVNLQSLRARFQANWDTTIDAFIRGRARRSGEPVFSWDVATVPSLGQYFHDPAVVDPDWRHKALKVHQDVILDVPDWPGDYRAWMEYWMFVYVSQGNLRAVVPMWNHWTEDGRVHDRVDRAFDDQVEEGRRVLENYLNVQLTSLDVLTGGMVQEIFYLPGAQGVLPGGDVFGNTQDDVTIALRLSALGYLVIDPRAPSQGA
jgi:hypothetical protein